MPGPGCAGVASGEVRQRKADAGRREHDHSGQGDGYDCASVERRPGGAAPLRGRWLTPVAGLARLRLAGHQSAQMEVMRSFQPFAKPPPDTARSLSLKLPVLPMLEPPPARSKNVMGPPMLLIVDRIDEVLLSMPDEKTTQCPEAARTWLYDHLYMLPL